MSSEFPYKESFVFRNNLGGTRKDANNNMFFNTAKKTWDCGLCRRAFKEKLDLEQHLSSGTHDAIKFSCSQCGKGFVSLGALTLHVEQAGHVSTFQKLLKDVEVLSTNKTNSIESIQHSAQSLNDYPHNNSSHRSFNQNIEDYSTIYATDSNTRHQQSPSGLAGYNTATFQGNPSHSTVVINNIHPLQKQIVRVGGGLQLPSNLLNQKNQNLTSQQYSSTRDQQFVSFNSSYSGTGVPVGGITYNNQHMQQSSNSPKHISKSAQSFHQQQPYGLGFNNNHIYGLHNAPPSNPTVVVTPNPPYAESGNRHHNPAATSIATAGISDVNSHLIPYNMETSSLVTTLNSLQQTDMSNQVCHLYLAGYTEKNAMEAACCYTIVIEEASFNIQIQDNQLNGGGGSTGLDPKKVGKIIADDTFLINQYYPSSIQPQYEALYEGLMKARELSIQNMVIFIDSELLYYHFMSGGISSKGLLNTIYRAVDHLFHYIKKTLSEFNKIEMKLVSSNDNKYMSSIAKTKFLRTKGLIDDDGDGEFNTNGIPVNTDGTNSKPDATESLTIEIKRRNNDSIVTTIHTSGSNFSLSTPLDQLETDHRENSKQQIYRDYVDLQKSKMLQRQVFSGSQVSFQQKPLQHQQQQPHQVRSSFRSNDFSFVNFINSNGNSNTIASSGQPPPPSSGKYVYQQNKQHQPYQQHQQLHHSQSQLTPATPARQSIYGAASNLHHGYVSGSGNVNVGNGDTDLNNGSRFSRAQQQQQQQLSLVNSGHSYGYTNSFADHSSNIADPRSTSATAALGLERDFSIFENAGGVGTGSSFGSHNIQSLLANYNYEGDYHTHRLSLAEQQNLQLQQQQRSQQQQLQQQQQQQQPYYRLGEYNQFGFNTAAGAADQSSSASSSFHRSLGRKPT